MSRRANTSRDAFTFSLGGLTTIASVVIAPAIADDRLNQSRGDRVKPACGDGWVRRRTWAFRLRRAT